jgi:hypothetical protein
MPLICENMDMARGWESKDVESQVDLLEAKQEKPQQHEKPGVKSVEQIRREQEKKNLELSRKRIVNSLETASNPNHRKSLEAALAHLDQKLSELA